MKTTAIIVAAGSGTRMHAEKNKVLLEINGNAVLYITLKAFELCACIDNIVLVTRECDIDECNGIARKITKNVQIVPGGKTRQESVLAGLYTAQNSDIAVIHDGARALITPEMIAAAVEDAKMHGASAPGVTPKDSLKTIDADGFITATIDRASAAAIQTPQVFGFSDILAAHKKAAADGFSATDDCALYEKYIGRVHVIPGDYENIKITTPEDMLTAGQILKKRGNICG